MIDVSFKAYLRKIGDVLDSNLIKVLTYSSKGSLREINP